VVGVVAIGLWALVAVPFAPTIGMPALAFANTNAQLRPRDHPLRAADAQHWQSGYARALGGLWRIALASAAMGTVIWGLLIALPLWAPTVFTLDSLRGQALTVLAAACQRRCSISR